MASGKINVSVENIFPLIKKFFDGQVRLLQLTPGNAEKMLGESRADKLSLADANEQAALVAVSRVIMNLDEFVTRD